MFSPIAWAEDSPIINAPSQVRQPLNHEDKHILDLQVHNIQVQAEWNVVGNEFEVDDNGALSWVGDISTDIQKIATVVVRDKFKILNTNYDDLSATAIITVNFMRGESAKIFVMGGATGPSAALNDVWSSADGGVNWSPLGNAGWTARSNFAAVVHGGKIFVMGGRANNDVNTLLNDVWSSVDGTSWSRENDAPWSARYGLRAVSYKGRIYMSGGTGSGILSNEIWSSIDGKTWQEHTGGNKFDARASHEMVVWNNQGENLMYVLGGLASNYRNEVFSSSDGTNWVRRKTQSSATNTWTRRANFKVLAHGKLFLMGGTDGSIRLQDAWDSSYYGQTWGTKPDNANVDWGRRQGLGGVVYGNRMYVLGGATEATGGAKSDVWASSDVITWEAVNTNPGWPARYQHQVVVHTTEN